MTTYDPQTALAVVDVQNDFADPAGGLYVSGGESIIELVNAQIVSASTAGALVVYSQDWHPEVTPHFEKDGGVWPVHCVADTWGAEFHPALKVLEDGPRVRKGVGGEDGYSVFSVRDPRTGAIHATQLEGLLRERGIEQLVIAGLATDYCVKETALDGLRLGFKVAVLGDCVRAVCLRRGDGERALKEVTAAGGKIS